MRVSTRFALVLIIGFVFQACISLASLPTLRQSLLRDRTMEVKHLVESAYGVASYYHEQARLGVMSDRAARTAARDAIRAMRYDDGNYFFVWALDGTGVVHGAHPEWEGRRFLGSGSAVKFPVVSHMVARLIEVAKSDKKEGVTTYRIPRAGQATPLDKVAYSRLYEPWGWSIGTGAYVDDIDETFRAQVLSLLGLFGGLILVAGATTFVLGRNLSLALARLTRRVTCVANGEFDGLIPGTERSDEVGVMARALRILRDNSKEAVALATLDHLTGLPNRKLLSDRLGQAMVGTVRSAGYCAVMLLNLDKFKLLNDSKGHEIGDLLLRAVAQCLRTSVREVDTVARLGADEFVVVLSDIGMRENDAVAACETIAAKVSSAICKEYQLDEIAHISSASIGITLVSGAEQSVEDVLKQADLAMYRAKDSGGNTWRFFDSGMEAVIYERLALESDLVRGIAENQFVLYYQAQVSSDGRLKGVEALIRWNHPVRGLVPPDKFIPFAEESGLILPLGRWVLETACRQIVAWEQQPEMVGLKIAVNVSSLQFQQPDFVEQVFSILRTTGADPTRLELELTESLLVEDVDAIIEKMTALRTRGVTFSLDDFGTGYSSLFYLKRMPLDTLKIDKSFVDDVLVDTNDAAIATTIVALAHALGLGVVAEGIETDAQRAFLAGHGCEHYQGYFFSRPLPVEKFTEYVLREHMSRPLLHC